MTLRATPSLGDTIGPIEVDRTTLEQLVRWAGAIDDYSPIHYDTTAALQRGLPGVVVNGPWKAAVLADMLSRWVGRHGSVMSLRCEYRKPDVVGTGLRLGGVVTDVRRDGAYDLVDCEVWVENDATSRTVSGTATVRTNRPEDDAYVTDGAADTVSLVGPRLRDALRMGKEAGRFTYTVEASDVRRFQEAVAGTRLGPEQYPVLGDETPATYYATVDPVERRDLQLEGVLEEIPYVKTGGGNAFNEVEYERPIRVGDVLTVVTTYEEVYERDGRSGRLLFRVRSNEIFDQEGELVGRTRMGHVLAYDLTQEVAR